MSFNYTRKITLALLLCALTACNTVKMVPFLDKQSVASVAIDTGVSLPEKITYYDLRKSYAIVFSLVAAMAVDRLNLPTMRDLEKLISDNNIDVAQIVRQAFSDQWAKQSTVPIDTGSVNRLSLEVLEYGLSVPELSTKSLVPTMKLRVTLRDEHNRVRWRAEQQLLAIKNPIPKQRLDTYFVQPETLRSAWKEAAEWVAAGLVSQL